VGLRNVFFKRPGNQLGLEIIELDNSDGWNSTTVVGKFNRFRYSKNATTILAKEFPEIS
jgi:hypothetical protein